MELTAQNVEVIFLDCLFRDGEDASKAKIVNGVVTDFGFHPERLENRKPEISELLDRLPDEFHANKGGGWSFLNACLTKSGEHWGEHRNIEQLLALGIATEQAKILMPREMWKLFPGGMPYFAVTPIAQTTPKT